MSVKGMFRKSNCQTWDGAVRSDSVLVAVVILAIIQPVHGLCVIDPNSSGHVTIPDSVTSIVAAAFNTCTRDLVSIDISDSVTSIGGAAFSYTHLTTVRIPDSVTFIGPSAFIFATSLTSVVISNSLTHTGNDVFASCISLLSVVIPDSITIIGSTVFRNCISLTSVLIPESVTLINDFAFQNCTALSSAAIASSVTTIGNNAFSDCGCPAPLYQAGAMFCNCSTCPPTAAPTASPTAAPTAAPTALPTTIPTAAPTAEPTAAPTASPTAQPTPVPSALPTGAPSARPTATPTSAPTAQPTAVPTAKPTAEPTSVPTASPTLSLELTSCSSFGTTVDNRAEGIGTLTAQQRDELWRHGAIGVPGSFTCQCSDCAIGAYCQYNRANVCSGLGTIQQPTAAFDEYAPPGTQDFLQSLRTMECVCDNGWAGRYCNDDSELAARESKDNFRLAYILTPVGLVLFSVAAFLQQRSAPNKSFFSRVALLFLIANAIVDLGSDTAFYIVSLHSARFTDLYNENDTGCSGVADDKAAQLQAAALAFLCLSGLPFALKLYRDATHYGGRDDDAKLVKMTAETVPQQHAESRGVLLHRQLRHVACLNVSALILEDIPFIVVQGIYNKTVGFEISVVNLMAVVSTLVTLLLHFASFYFIAHFSSRPWTALQSKYDGTSWGSVFLRFTVPLNDPWDSRHAVCHAGERTQSKGFLISNQAYRCPKPTSVTRSNAVVGGASPVKASFLVGAPTDMNV